jgi:hypothetical protein
MDARDGGGWRRGKKTPREECERASEREQLGRIIG